ncbi:MAG: DUF2924 domain-containing protein [Armatimonadota bacterium]
MDTSIIRQIIGLPDLTTPELQELWKTINGKEAPAFSRLYLVKRLAYRMQEIAFGGLSTCSIQLMDEILESYGFDRYGRLGPRPVKTRKRIDEMHDRPNKTIINSDASTITDDIGIVVHVPLTLKRRSGHTQLVGPATDADDINFRLAHQEAIVIAISRAHRWRDQLEDGTYDTLSALAKQIFQDISFTSRLLRLSLLSPRVIESILTSREPDGLSLHALTKLLPMIWVDQEAELGFPM